MQRKGANGQAQAERLHARLCEETVYAYYAENLSKEERQEFESHLEQCETCQDTVTMLASFEAKVWDACMTKGIEALTDDPIVIQAVRKRMESMKQNSARHL